MKKRIIFSVIILITAISLNLKATSIDSSNTNNLIAFDWEVISDIDKVLQYENPKDLSKRSIDQSKRAAEHYTAAISLMGNKEYPAAIIEFKAAMKRYKRAKLSNDALNFIRTNMALSYANTGNKEDVVVSQRLLSLITSKVHDDNKWSYNVAIANHLVGNQDDAATHLSSVIKKDEFNFQAYVTLEAIYRNSGNDKDADKVQARMQKAEDKLSQRKQKTSTKKEKTKGNKSKKEEFFIPKGEKPDVTNLKIVKTDNHLQFDKIDKIDERSMAQIQEGIGAYNLGVNSLSKKEYKTAQNYLKDSEKRLKRAKVSEDGLNFSRGNLAISFLATGEKRGVSNAKRYLKYLTPKLYNTREWTYNIAVAQYDFASKSKGVTKEEYMKESIKLFQKSIKQDRLFLPPYANLIYIYKQQGEDKKALKIADAFKKSALELMTSYSKEDQIAKGGDAYIFRLNLGTFGDFDTPADVFEESNVITIPISARNTAYLAGLFYTLDEVLDYQEKMNEKGYTNSFIVAFKDGEKFEF